MNSKWIYVAVFLVSVLISSVSQVGLKKSTQKEYDSSLKEYFNPLVIGSYAMFFIATILTTFAYRGVSLSFGPILESTAYVYVAILGTLILKEKMTKKKIIGNAIIILGIFIYSI